MEFRLDDGQIELQQTVTRFCVDRFPLDALGDREGVPLDRSIWVELAKLGVLALLLPESTGGVGAGVVEAAIVFEQLGSHLVPGPVLWTLLAAPFVPGAASGEQLVMGVDATSLLDGSVVVEHAAELDMLLVVGDDGVVAHRTSELAPPTPLGALDPLAPVGRFTGLDGGEVVGDSAVAFGIRVLGTVLSAAMLTGVSSRALEVARGYALERQQFGVPIGSFQAIKHMLSDMYVRTVSAESVTYAAAAVIDQPGDEDPTRVAASAKLLASEAAIENSSTAIQILGGMGFTWDMLPNYLLKRSWAIESDFGLAEEHQLYVGSTLGVAG